MDRAIHSVRTMPTRATDALEFAMSFPEHPVAPAALICSPQPFLGGDLDNNVTRALAESFARSGRPAFRFNYRSVGKSRDAVPERARYDYWRDVEERGARDLVIADALAAWTHARMFAEVGVIAGYSFGAWVALQVAERVAPAAPIVLVAPPFRRLDFSAIARRAAPVLLIVPGADELEPPPARPELAARYPRSTTEWLDGADHFLRGFESNVGAHAVAFASSPRTVAAAESSA